MGNACSGAAQKEEVVPAEPAAEEKEEANPDLTAEEEPAELAEPVPKFTVSLVGARGLRNADWLPGSGKSDAYLELKTGSKLHHKTAVINDCLEPVWREECKIMELADDAELEFYVYDKDLVTSTKLGKAVMKHDDFMDGFCGELELEDTGKKAGDKAYLRIKIKAGDNDYPPGPPAEVTMTVERESNQKPWGLDLDLQDAHFLYVKSVDDGPFKQYNAEKPAKEQLVPGDYIAKVNDATGNAKEMVDVMKAEPKVTLLVHRNCYQTILFEKAEEELGLTLPPKLACEFLAIRGVEGGAAKKHNESATGEMKFYPGDRIVSVAGMRGKASDLLAKIKKQTGKFQLVVERPAGTDGSATWRTE